MKESSRISIRAYLTIFANTDFSREFHFAIVAGNKKIYKKMRILVSN